MELERLDSWKEMMRSSCKANRLRTSLANELTLLKLKFLNDKLAKRYVSCHTATSI